MMRLLVFDGNGNSVLKREWETHAEGRAGEGSYAGAAPATTRTSVTSAASGCIEFQRFMVYADDIGHAACIETPGILKQSPCRVVKKYSVNWAG